MTYLALKISAILMILASSLTVHAKELMPPTLIRQSYSYDTEIKNADDLYNITVTNKLAISTDWDDDTVLEMKFDGSSTVVKITGQQGKDGALEFKATVDKNYPANLQKPDLQFENYDLNISLPGWHALKNGVAKTQYRYVNNGDATAWMSFASALEPFIIHQDELKFASLVGTPKNKSLTNWVDLFLSKIILSNYNLTYSLRVSYEYPLEPASPNTEWVVLPVLLLAPNSYDKTDAGQIAKAIESYINAERPEADGAQLVFSIDVYRSNQTPLLQVQEAELPLTSITWK
ncbi:MAG: hypothetical protein OM95_12190 [Bdellovibrio sp. ArHS]|uniref:hypothetical protein n=1 Tax=Bdellovibrio sp. ArHS TaxID=1569284 RepID=UPI0005839B8E|nr:hypothetical protein [Bdellovibrio sp. ArHS]KHD87769.1 MAG: hypothetical protein OM95_12190 [Bdellovibrio sp. ArHS]